MNKKFKALKAAKDVVLIKTTHPDGTDFKGIILDDKKLFIVIREIKSFEADGIIVLPKKWITTIRNGKYEKCATEIFNANRQPGALDDAGAEAIHWYADLTGLEEIIAYLKTEDIWPGIEVIYNDEASLYMGPVTDASENSFKLYCFDAAGKWEKEYELDYDEIFKIEIDSKYVSRFNAYMKTRPRPG